MDTARQMQKDDAVNLHLPNKEETLTEEMKRAYINSGGNICPYCQSDDITAEDTDYFGSSQSTRVLCNDCKRYWFDIYILTDIQEA